MNIWTTKKGNKIIFEGNTVSFGGKRYKVLQVTKKGTGLGFVTIYYKRKRAAIDCPNEKCEEIQKELTQYNKKQLENLQNLPLSESDKKAKKYQEEHDAVVRVQQRGF